MVLDQNSYAKAIPKSFNCHLKNRAGIKEIMSSLKEKNYTLFVSIWFRQKAAVF